MVHLFAVFTFCLFVVQSAFSGPNFTPLRDDQNVPNICQDMNLSFFSLPVETFIVGREGAKNMGFNFEYPIRRENASVLWSYFKNFTKGEDNIDLLNKIKNDTELFRDYQIIMRNYQEQDFDFASEGEILELLAIEYLYQIYPENTYYITGGVEYHESNSPMTIGELDVYVGHRENCSAVAVGEAKLGTGKMLKKAHDQLERFENFLMEHNVPVIH